MEHSSGAIIFYYDEARHIREYLLLYTVGRSGRGFWAFPKGHLEEKETELEAATREVSEETGLKDLKFIPEFKEKEKYFFREKGKSIHKEVSFFLAQSFSLEVTLSIEHSDFVWLPFKEALERITFKSGKNILAKADTFLIHQQSSLL